MAEADVVSIPLDTHCEICSHEQCSSLLISCELSLFPARDSTRLRTHPSDAKTCRKTSTPWHNPVFSIADSPASRQISSLGVIFVHRTCQNHVPVNKNTQRGLSHKRLCRQGLSHLRINLAALGWNDSAIISHVTRQLLFPGLYPTSHHNNPVYKELSVRRSWISRPRNFMYGFVDLAA